MTLMTTYCLKVTVSVHQRYLRFLMTETYKDMPHCLRKAYQKLIHFTMVRMQSFSWFSHMEYSSCCCKVQRFIF